MEEAIKCQSIGLTGDSDVFQQKLKEWKIISRRPLTPPRERGSSLSRGARRTASAFSSVTIRTGMAS